MRTCTLVACEKPHRSKGLCQAHYTRLRKYGDPLGTAAPYVQKGVVRKPLADRFWAKVDRRSDDECWLWTGSLSAGYGRISVTTPDGRKTEAAYRVAWELLVGPIPAGLEPDHLCRVTACVNPKHLEPVTHAENVRRGKQGRMVTACPRDHAYTPENTYIRPNGQGGRRCRTCIAAAARRRRAA